MQTISTSGSFRIILTISILVLCHQSANADLAWTQAGGRSGTSGSGAHVNSFVNGTGSHGSASLVAAGTLLSYGTVTDGTRTADFAVNFVGGQNPLRSAVVNNSFVINADNTADFFTSLSTRRGSTAAGTFADNGNASISVSFFLPGTYNNVLGIGISTDATFSLVAANIQPNVYPGGAKINRLSSSEFYDIDWSGGGSPIEVDPLDQVILDQTLNLNRLANYDPNRLPLGSTGVNDPGTGGFTDPLVGDLRLEFNKNHQVSEGVWEVTLPKASTFTITRRGDDGQRSGIGIGGVSISAITVPEPSALAVMMLIGVSLASRRQRRGR